MSEPLDLEPIKAREQAATPGPWEWELKPNAYGDDGEMQGAWMFAPFKLYQWSPVRRTAIIDVNRIHQREAEFIAHARADVPALIAEVERLRQRLTSVIQINDALLEDVADLRAGKQAGFTEPTAVASPSMQALMRDVAQADADAMERLNRAVEATAPLWDALKRKHDEEPADVAT